MISPHGSQTLTGINMTADRATVLAPGRPQHIMHSGQPGTRILYNYYNYRAVRSYDRTEPPPLSNQQEGQTQGLYIKDFLI